MEDQCPIHGNEPCDCATLDVDMDEDEALGVTNMNDRYEEFGGSEEEY